MSEVPNVRKYVPLFFGLGVYLEDLKTIEDKERR